ncbi:hypothetical protein ASD86_03940 [Lysobacter sp. Root690]|nr:hypothetical protein ASD86_03940 [Lysobacter sp. Root690]
MPISGSGRSPAVDVWAFAPTMRMGFPVTRRMHAHGKCDTCKEGKQENRSDKSIISVASSKAATSGQFS